MTTKRLIGWRHDVAMDFDIEACVPGEPAGHLLVVHFWGSYWPQDRRREGGGFMRMVVAAALAWERGPGLGLVVDLARLEYPGGDRLFYWKTALRPFGLSAENYALALVWAPHNWARIRSLLEEEGDDELLHACFVSVDEAEDSVCSRRRQP